MTNKIILIFLALFCISCTSRIELDKPIKLSYSSEQIIVNITLTHRSKNKFTSGPESWYSFYGTLDSQLLTSKKELDMVFLILNEKKSDINLDIEFGDVDFWDRHGWDEKGFRKDKIYISFPDNEPDWKNIKFIEIERGKEWMYH